MLLLDNDTPASDHIGEGTEEVDDRCTESWFEKGLDKCGEKIKKNACLGFSILFIVIVVLSILLSTPTSRRIQLIGSWVNQSHFFNWTDLNDTQESG